MTAKKEFHIPVSVNEISAVDYLAEASGFSKQKIKQYMQQGCVWLERVKTNEDSADYIQRLRRAKKRLTKNHVLHFYFDESVLARQTSPAVLLKDFGDYSVWNKPTGMLSQGSKWGDHCTIYRWAEKHLQPERSAFIVHRLDRAANGLIILAHKKKVASQFSKMFENREIEKHYQVTVEGEFLKGDGLTIEDEIDNKKAISHVKELSFNQAENTSTLEVKIETGRKHQIRKHLAGIGFPVLGDRLYGSQQNVEEYQKANIDLQLQAKYLGFICPISNEKREFKLDC